MNLFNLILVMVALFALTTMASADPYSIIAWYEDHPDDRDSTFNMRFDPFHKDLPNSADIRIFFPPGTIQLHDRRDMRCSLYSSGNRRYYEQPDVKPTAKYGSPTTKTTHMDIHWPSSWFNAETENLLIRCFGLKISPEDLEAAYGKNNDGIFTVWLDEERREYTLKPSTECMLPNGKRY